MCIINIDIIIIIINIILMCEMCVYYCVCNNVCIMIICVCV